MGEKGRIHNKAKKNSAPKIDVCQKAVYVSEIEAIEAFKAIKLLAKFQRVALPTNHYKCPKCHFWHLTTGD